jgi:cysteine-rich repeat protein
VTTGSDARRRFGLSFGIVAVLLLGAPGRPALGQAPTCQNGIREAGEQCDDGNGNNLDGCSSQCRFEQVQRINQLKMQFGSAASCTANNFGGAIGSLAQASFQQSFDQGVASGETSILLAMLGLDDLAGASDPAVQVGVVNGSPVPGAGYDGTSDVDWWYTVDPAGVDANRVPRAQLSGSIASSLLTAGPGSADLTLALWTRLTWHFSSLRISAASGPSSTPLASTGAAPPGHVPSEHLDPTLKSYGSSGSGISGELCGNIGAVSLASTPVPPSLLPGGGTTCAENYSVANSFLDVLVGGCHSFIVTLISSTQPDQQDPQAPPAGAGPPYVLSAGTNHIVNACRDHTGATVALAACLADAAYSSFFKFSTDRVIAVCVRPAAPVASSNGPICAGQTLQLMAAGAAGSYAWTGPNGFTSTLQNPQIPAATAAASGTYSVTVTAPDGCTSFAGTTTAVVNATCGGSFFPVTPCRVVDTRNATGAYGGPALDAGSDRAFVVAGQCGIPSSATVVSVNVTVTQPSNAGDLRIYPGGSPLPLVSTINYRPSQTRANNAVVSLGPSGDFVVHCDQAAGTVHLIVDTNGYIQ